MRDIKLPSIFLLPPQDLSILKLPPIHYLAPPLYKCDLCSKEFTLKSSLIRHFRKHASENRYKCKICCKSFTRKDILNNHKKSRKCIIKTTKFYIIGTYVNEIRGFC